MVNLPRWQRILILAIIALGAILFSPNLFYSQVEQANDAKARIAVEKAEEGDEALAQSWPSWAPSQIVNLGLDLRGGVHVLTQVELAQVYDERYEEVWFAFRDALAANAARFGTVTRAALDEGFLVQIGNASELEGARELMDQTARDLGVSGFEMAVVDGGVSVTLSPAAKAGINATTMAQSLEIIRRRIDTTGTKEPTIQQFGDDRISIDVPGLASVDELLRLLGRTAKLTLHQVTESTTDPNLRVDFDEILLAGPEGQYYRMAKVPAISGEMIVDARLDFHPTTNEPVVSFRLNPEGAQKFGNFTSQHTGELFAIVLDGEVISAPAINEPILQGSAFIEGNFTIESATELSALLKSGALPAELTVLEQSVVGPDMGQDSIDAGRFAAMISLIAVAAYMIWAYRIYGVFANIALVINMMLIVAALSVIGATLTLPGIAGIILTIGMAVDANVLIFERIREEYNKKPVLIRAIDEGFARALSSILDANITTFIAAVVLYIFGAGAVRGFAVTLMIGIVTSVFTAVYCTRLLIIWLIERRRPKTFNVAPLRFDRKFGFMKIARWALRASFVLVVISFALLFTKGPNYGIDFRGGTEVKIEVASDTEIADVRALVSSAVEGDVGVTTETGAPNGREFMKIRISSDGEEAAMSETQINELRAVITTNFDSAEVRGVNAIGGAVSGELVQKGLMAVGITLFAIGIYIWLRFEWSFAIGAIVALVHDVGLTLGVFVISGVTFDLSVVAALLAIIGYSLNDTVVVYDRIREKLSMSKSTPLDQVIDNGVNETLPRTLRTSVTTLLAVGILYLLGGAELQGFSFAMIVGVLVGTYSSIFIASPVLNLIGVDRGDKPKATTKFADIDA